MSRSLNVAAADAAAPFIVDVVTPCAEAPEMWFADRKPGTGGGLSREQAEAVKGCKRCPELAKCLERALANREPFGIWGATTPEQRQAMLKRGAA